MSLYADINKYLSQCDRDDRIDDLADHYASLGYPHDEAHDLATQRERMEHRKFSWNDIEEVMP
jgi:hypothetical protein